MAELGRRSRFRHGGTLHPILPTPSAVKKEQGQIRFYGIRHDARRRFLRRFRLTENLTPRPTLFRNRRAWLYSNMFTGLCGRRCGSRSHSLLHRTGSLPGGLAPAIFRNSDSAKTSSVGGRRSSITAYSAKSKHAELMTTLTIKHAIGGAMLPTSPSGRSPAAGAGGKAQAPEAWAHHASTRIAPPRKCSTRRVNYDPGRPAVLDHHRPWRLFSHGKYHPPGGAMECPVLTTFKGKGRLRTIIRWLAGVLGRMKRPRLLADE